MPGPLTSHPAPQGNAALVDTLNRVQFGLIITSPNVRPTFVNAYAQRLLDQQDGLVATDRGLEALQAAHTRVLRELIASAASRQLTSCGTVQLPRNRVARPLIVYVPGDGYAQAIADSVAVYVCDPHHQPTVDPSLLSRLFGFTRAESTLAVLLLNGITIEQAARQLFVSEHTVRTHVKRMLLKTDTGRQTELVRLLLTCAAQVRLG